MPTLVLPPRLTEDCDRLAAAAKEMGWDIYAATGWRFPDGIVIPEPVIYADPLFADIAAAALGVRLLDPPADWLTTLPHHFTKRAIEFTILEQARASVTTSRFIKPAEDKSFPARVYANGAELPGMDSFPPETPVLISEPVVWRSEFRCFVLNGKVAAISPYLRDGELAQNEAGVQQ